MTASKPCTAELPEGLLKSFYCKFEITSIVKVMENIIFQLVLYSLLIT